MCIGSYEPGGPRRCSYHARKRRDDTAAHCDAAQRRVTALTSKLEDASRQVDDVYREAGVTRNPFHEITGSDERFAGLSDEQRHRVQQAETLREEVASKVAAAGATLHRREAAADKARDEYFTTREGVGVLAADMDRLALLHAQETDTDKRSELAVELRSTMRKLADSEQAMLNEQRRIEQRWGLRQRPQVRGARLGVGDAGEQGNAAALVAAGRCMSGSYTNTFRPDPDAQATPDSVPDGDARLRCSRMELVRTTPSGDRLSLTIPVELSSGDERGGPSVAQALNHAVSMAESYDADYSSWAQAHHYETDPKAPWCGSRSYSEGRAAWETAQRVREGVVKFLAPSDYSMIRRQLRETSETVDASV